MEINEVICFDTARLWMKMKFPKLSKPQIEALVSYLYGHGLDASNGNTEIEWLDIRGINGDIKPVTARSLCKKGLITLFYKEKIWGDKEPHENDQVINLGAISQDMKETFENFSWNSSHFTCRLSYEVFGELLDSYTTIWRKSGDKRREKKAAEELERKTRKQRVHFFSMLIDKVLKYHGFILARRDVRILDIKDIAQKTFVIGHFHDDGNHVLLFTKGPLAQYIELQKISIVDFSLVSNNIVQSKVYLAPRLVMDSEAHALDVFRNKWPQVYQELYEMFEYVYDSFTGQEDVDLDALLLAALSSNHKYIGV